MVVDVFYSENIENDYMALLLNSEIRDRVAKSVRGHVARVGGTMDQLVSYENCRVKDINLIDGGFGSVKKIRTVANILSLAKYYMRQEFEYWRTGGASSRDRKTLILDMHYAYTQSNFFNRFDCLISSNMIEHSPNPIWLLLNFYFFTRVDGFQYHAIPHYQYTYDCFRKPTRLEHFIKDFERMIDKSDKSHSEDYIQSAIVKHGWQKTFHETHPVAYPYMHYHVFDEDNVRSLFDFMFEDVTNDIIKDDRFSDNVVICRNRLKPSFIKKYESLIREYQEQMFKI